MADKPICFLDVDGVINTVRPNRETATTLEAEGFTIHMPRGTRERIERLADRFTMAWCTTWEHLANKHFNTFFGFDDWPVVEWNTETTTHQLHKFDGIHKFLKDDLAQPFVYIDDDMHWLVKDVPFDPYVVFGNMQLLIPETMTGLTDQHVDLAIQFAEELNA